MLPSQRNWLTRLLHANHSPALVISGWQTALLGQDNPQRRIARIIRSYEEQGIHRTGTKVDQVSGDWLATEVRQRGLTPARETFNFSSVDPVTASLSANGRRVEGIMLCDGGFTDAAGVTGRVGLLASDATIGLTEAAQNTAVVFVRYDANNKEINRFPSLYAVTLQNGHAGVQARSSYAA